MRRPARGGPSRSGLLAAFLFCGSLWLCFGLGGLFLLGDRLLLGSLLWLFLFVLFLFGLGLRFRLGLLLRRGFLRAFGGSLFGLCLGLRLLTHELEDCHLGRLSPARS